MKATGGGKKAQFTKSQHVHKNQRNQILKVLSAKPKETNMAGRFLSTLPKFDSL